MTYLEKSVAYGSNSLTVRVSPLTFAPTRDFRDPSPLCSLPRIKEVNDKPFIVKYGNFSISQGAALAAAAARSRQYQRTNIFPAAATRQI